MARKEIAKIIKVNLKGGAASPAPPLGPALSAAGVQVMDFVRTFNDATRPRADELLPTEIFIYKDKSWDYKIKTPITSILVKKELSLEKGSSEPNRVRVGQLSREQLERIARIKLPDLNTNDIEAAMRTIAGTCRQMGVNVEGYHWEVPKARKAAAQPVAAPAPAEGEEEGGEE